MEDEYKGMLSIVAAGIGMILTLAGVSSWMSPASVFMVCGGVIFIIISFALAVTNEGVEEEGKCR